MASYMKFRLILSFVFVLILAAAVTGDATAQNQVLVSSGQVVYVPAYSHIYIGNRERPFLLAVTLSIRNTDLIYPVIIERVSYHNSDGKLLEEYVKSPIKLESMAATRFVVHESDKSGGSGASFIVEWKSVAPVSSPIIETIMIGAQTQQGISFTSRGKVIREK